MDIRVSVLIDGAFFLKRLEFFKRKYFSNFRNLTPKETTTILAKLVTKHVANGGKHDNNALYRAFFYDSPPLDIKVHYPLKIPGETNPRVLDFSKEPRTIFRKELFDEIRKQRKFALRLGTIKHDKQWKLNDHALKQLLKGERTFDELTNDDFYYSMRQKGVDTKLGVDISTLAHNKLVDRIILIAGDSDFVPAAKLARVSGVDFVLDALRNNIEPKLHEHIDGLISWDLVALIKDVTEKEPDMTPAWWENGSNPQKRKQNPYRSNNKRPKKRNKRNKSA